MLDTHSKQLKGWEAKMELKKMKHNIAACWTAAILNPIWLIVDYFSAPEYIIMDTIIDIPVTLMILGMIYFHKQLRMNASMIGFTTILLLSFSAAFICSHMEVADFEIAMLSYSVIFIGAGMLVIFEMVYSVIVVVLSVLMNILFYQLYSPLTVYEFLYNGGLIVFIVSVFMIISIQIKYRLTSRSIVSKLILRNNQDELVAAKLEAERSKQLQSQFLSKMSHEIRTPMNGIMGITRILRKSSLNDEQRRYLDAIYRSSENLMVIINDILDFSKIEAGKVILEKTRFNLDHLLSDLQEIFILRAEEKGIYLTIDKDADVPSIVIGDPVRLNQILSNLVGNAIKFTEYGGITISVSTEKRDDSHATLHFRVRDTGIGIPENKLESVFQSFTQASSSTTRTHGGTGLGLTITKELIQLHEGDIWVESILDQGTTFHFKLRYEIVEQTPEEEQNIQILKQLNNERIIENLQGRRVLLAEDHPINQMLAMKVLKDWGISVDLAENGKIAVERLGQTDYDLVLMDISMPEMDGYQATQEIRKGGNVLRQDVPIIAMTASAFLGENQKCFKFGMNDYISKPFDPQDLLEKMYKHIYTQKRA